MNIYRQEYKYIKNVKIFSKIVNFTNLGFIKEIHNKRMVNSIYFDDFHNTAFFEAEEGIRPRKKIRIRNYNKSNEFFLEEKQSFSHYRSKNTKHIDNNLKNNLIFKGIFDKKLGMIYPKIHINYSRRYFLFDEIRITIDENLNYNLFNSNIIYKDKFSIIEFKSSSHNSLDKIINLCNEYPVKFSKYCEAYKKIYNTNSV